jgi:hypothetical protein
MSHVFYDAGSEPLLNLVFPGSWQTEDDPVFHAEQPHLEPDDADPLPPLTAAALPFIELAEDNIIFEESVFIPYEEQPSAYHSFDLPMDLWSPDEPEIFREEAQPYFSSDEFDQTLAPSPPPPPVVPPMDTWHVEDDPIVDAQAASLEDDPNEPLLPIILPPTLPGLADLFVVDDNDVPLLDRWFDPSIVESVHFFQPAFHPFDPTVTDEFTIPGGGLEFTIPEDA